MDGLKHLALLVTLSGISVSTYADKISSLPDSGFGGWNLETNVTVVLDGAGSSFNESDGTYAFSSDSDYSYQANVDNAAAIPTIMGYVLAKDWPVGEPPGIKVIHDDLGVKPPKPQNCIMATSYLEGYYLDSTDPQQAICSSPFQTHKRYKLAMLPSTVAEGSTREKGIDLEFNVEREAGTRDYQVFQKINNWTDGRLEGFRIEVGFGVGENFLPIDEANLANLHVSVPSDIWNPSQLAVFSAGLFGPEDKHTGKRGFFDPYRRAGFRIDEYGVEGLHGSLNATTTLGSDYQQLPPVAGTPSSQFGPWLPNNMLPYGIFFDDDNNPQTDAELLAWYGHNPVIGGLGWMSGAADDFAEVDISSWGDNLLYTMGLIDDLVNVGLNYIVTVGDIAPYDSFTIRITPRVDTSGTPAPSYVGEVPDPELIYASTVGNIEIAPEGTFVTGDLLTARVGDGGPDVNNPVEIDTVDVTISAVDAGGAEVFPEETLTLIEQGENRGVFAALLPIEFSEVAAGVEVVVVYADASEGDEKSTSTTATDAPEPPPVYPDVSITTFLVPEIVYNGQTKNLKLYIKNWESEALASGSVLLTGSDGSEFSEDFVGLEPGGTQQFSFAWTSALADPGIAEVVEWTATLRVLDSDSEIKVVDGASAFTKVEVKNFEKRTYSNKLPSGTIGTLSFTTEDETCEFSSPPQFLPEGEISPPSPDAIILPEGVVKFDTESCDEGATVVVTMDYGNTLPAGSTFWKVDSPEWRPITGATISGSVVTYSITDGGENDEDGVVNGRIVDPSGVAVPVGSSWPGGVVAQIPVNNPMALLFMAIGLVLLAFRERAARRLL